MTQVRQALAGFPGLVGKAGRGLVASLRHRALVWGLAVLVVGALAGSGLLWSLAVRPAATGNQPGRLVRLAPGVTTRGLTRELSRQGLIRHPVLFRALARLSGLDRSLQAGDYELNAAMTPLDILRILASGHTVTRQVTIPEGFSAKEIAARLSAAGLGSPESIIALIKDPGKVFAGRPPAALAGVPSLEGYLYPDTYEVGRGETAQGLLARMVQRFLEVALPLYFGSPQSARYTLPQVVTVASLVEAEAKAPAERETIAGVFYNRLREGIALQSCATVEYALGRHKTALTLADLAVDSPYNTYLHPGLPPGPINSPGRASLAAAARPSATPYLYFVARGDGTHQFSRTFSEHLAAQRKYEGRR
ncbi:MAG: endolytic transglycosylase MltG [Chitinophagales bacterium]